MGAKLVVNVRTRYGLNTGGVSRDAFCDVFEVGRSDGVLGAVSDGHPYPRLPPLSPAGTQRFDGDVRFDARLAQVRTELPCVLSAGEMTEKQS